MDSYQGRIWYERALFYGQNGDEKNAKKAYAIALRYDPQLPPLPKFRNHHVLKSLEHVSLIAALLVVGWLIYLFLLHPVTSANVDFPTRVWVFVGKTYNSDAGEGTLDSSKGNQGLADGASGIPGETSSLPENPENASGMSSRLPYILLRNALYYYTADHAQFPDKLDDLIKATYLEEVPAEPVSGSNKVYPHFTDEGGWVYAPPKVYAPQHLAEQVEVSVYANQRDMPTYPFVPMRLEVNTSEPKVTLLSGNYPLKSWPAAVGTPSTPTPDGRFRIIEKHILGQSAANPYGSRWMQLGEQPPDRPGSDPLAGRGIGLHGTQSPDDLGSYVTNGCVRMRNTDIEELFQLIPNGIRVDVTR